MKTTEERTEPLALVSGMRRAIIRHTTGGRVRPGGHALGPDITLDDLTGVLQTGVAELRAQTGPSPWLTHLARLTDAVAAIDEDLHRHHSFTPGERRLLPRLERELLDALAVAERSIDRRGAGQKRGGAAPAT